MRKQIIVITGNILLFCFHYQLRLLFRDSAKIEVKKKLGLVPNTQLVMKMKDLTLIYLEDKPNTGHLFLNVYFNKTMKMKMRYL